MNWEGSLTKTRYGPKLTTMGWDNLLTKHGYFFHGYMPDDEHPFIYLICPYFQKWKFPLLNFPTKLAKTLNATNGASGSIPINLTAAVLFRDRSCRITGYYYDNVERAHYYEENEKNKNAV